MVFQYNTAAPPHLTPIPTSSSVRSELFARNCSEYCWGCGRCSQWEPTQPLDYEPSVPKAELKEPQMPLGRKLLIAAFVVAGIAALCLGAYYGTLGSTAVAVIGTAYVFFIRGEEFST